MNLDSKTANNVQIDYIPSSDTSVIIREDVLPVYAGCFYIDDEILKSFTEKLTQETFKRIENIRILESFKILKDNWDGYNAPAIDFYLIEKCKEIVNSFALHIQPDIFPTGRNSIQFEYESDDGKYLEIEIFLDKMSLYYTDNETEIDNDNISFDKANIFISKFHSQFFCNP
jgi:hypothetical protein